MTFFADDPPAVRQLHSGHDPHGHFQGIRGQNKDLESRRPRGEDDGWENTWIHLVKNGEKYRFQMILTL